MRLVHFFHHCVLINASIENEPNNSSLRVGYHKPHCVILAEGLVLPHNIVLVIFRNRRKANILFIQLVLISENQRRLYGLECTLLIKLVTEQEAKDPQLVVFASLVQRIGLELVPDLIDDVPILFDEILD